MQTVTEIAKRVNPLGDGNKGYAAAALAGLAVTLSGVEIPAFVWGLLPAFIGIARRSFGKKLE